MRKKLGNTAIVNKKRERPKVQYALAIEGDEDIRKVVEGDGEESGVEMTF